MWGETQEANVENFLALLKTRANVENPEGGPPIRQRIAQATARFVPSLSETDSQARNRQSGLVIHQPRSSVGNKPRSVTDGHLRLVLWCANRGTKKAPRGRLDHGAACVSLPVSAEREEQPAERAAPPRLALVRLRRLPARPGAPCLGKLPDDLLVDLPAALLVPRPGVR